MDLPLLQDQALISFEIIGKTPPTTFAKTTVKNKLKQTVNEIIKSAFVNKYNLKKFTIDKTVATIILTLNSLNITFK